MLWLCNTVVCANVMMWVSPHMWHCMECAFMADVVLLVSHCPTACLSTDCYTLCSSQNKRKRAQAAESGKAAKKLKEFKF